MLAAGQRRLVAGDAGAQVDAVHQVQAGQQVEHAVHARDPTPPPPFEISCPAPPVHLSVRRAPPAPAPPRGRARPSGRRPRRRGGDGAGVSSGGMERSGTETVWRRLSADGLRRTPQREAILDALSDAGEALPLPVLLARGRRRAPGLGERTAERTVRCWWTAARWTRSPGRGRGRLPALRARPPPPPGLHLLRHGGRARPVRHRGMGGRPGRAPGLPGGGPRGDRSRRLRGLPGRRGTAPAALSERRRPPRPRGPAPRRA